MGSAEKSELAFLFFLFSDILIKINNQWINHYWKQSLVASVVVRL